VWGSGNFVPLGSALMLGSPTADSETELKNAIDLAAGDRTINVNDNPATAADFATISGAISNGSVAKTGPGTLVLSVANSLTGTTVSEGTLLVENASGSATGAGPVTVGAATLGGTGFINGPVTLTGDSTLTSTGTLTINSTLNVQGLANQLSSGTVNTTGDVTILPGAVFIINGTLGGGTGSLIIYGTLMGKGTINKSCVIEAGGVLSPGDPSTIQATARILDAAAPRNFSFEIGAAEPNYASPSNSINDVIRLTDAAMPFADASGAAPAALTADTVIDVYFLSSDPALGEYKAEFFAATDFSDAVADATYQYWRLDPRGSRYHNGNFYSPLDAALVDWSVVPETAVFDGMAASGYITEFTVVPEPATLALAVMGGLGVLLRRRRR
jgi:autotransporter-associated beta strand protein